MGVRLLSLMCDTGKQKNHHKCVCVCVFASILYYFLHHKTLNDEGFGGACLPFNVAARLFPGLI